MPSLKNIWINPQTRVINDDGQIASIEVSGMLCEWGWARNVQAALVELQGVTSVEHEAGSDVFVVKHEGGLNDAVNAVDRIVIFKGARRELEKIGRLLQSVGTK